MSTASAPWPSVWVAALLAGSTLLPATAVPEPRTAARQAAPSRVVCDAAIQHPLRVKITALDPAQRGGIVRVRVTTGSRHPLERGEVRLVSAGAATVMGSARVPFGRLNPGDEATSDFSVRLPAEGRRFLLQFRVTGDGQNGLESRGATLNLLPDGPADPGRVVTSDTGRQIAEYRARRIDR
jgi:hypothetical protein